MNNRRRSLFLMLCTMFLLVASVSASALDAQPVELKKDDRCAVCGMFVAKYKAWVAEIVFSDSGYTAFDGPKDMFKYYLNLARYTPSRKPSDISAIYVTEYYSAKLMDARKMFYVSGSNVSGPMGEELVPVASEEKAKEFMKDHRGKAILKFQEITTDHLR